jgi:hypothetical protein
VTLGYARCAHRLDQIVDRMRRNPRDIGALGSPPSAHSRPCQGDCEAIVRSCGSRKPGEVGALAIAVALREPLGALLALAGSGQRADLKRHQALRCKTECPAGHPRQGPSPDHRL